jgi:glycopeptide antibiotics resistance protein
LSCIGIGLAVHRGWTPLGAVARDVTGDALWAMMISGWLGVLNPQGRGWVRASVALAVCFTVEFSQLVHAPALDAIRATRWGHLLLGRGFDPRDLLAYTVGVMLALLIQSFFESRGGTNRAVRAVSGRTESR